MEQHAYGQYPCGCAPAVDESARQPGQTWGELRERSELSEKRDIPRPVQAPNPEEKPPEETGNENTSAQEEAAQPPVDISAWLMQPRNDPNRRAEAFLPEWLRRLNWG